MKIACFLAFSGALWAQNGAPEVALQARTFQFISADAHIEGKTVTNAPYSGEGVTETTRVLADGTRIVNKSTVNVWRDGLGRTRREQKLAAIGPWAAEGEAPTIITIHDPVAGETIMLDTREKTARRLKGNSGMFTVSKALPGTPASDKVISERHVMIAEHGGGKFEAPVRMPLGGAAGAGVPGDMIYVRRSDNGNEKKESLGKQNMEGVLVEGSRMTHTIPAGEIGNDRPIMSTVETWTSPDLQVTVMSKTTDPQFGETVYKLTNIQRREPAPALFQIPADYKVTEMPAAGGVRVEMKK